MNVRKYLLFNLFLSTLILLPLVLASNASSTPLGVADAPVCRYGAYAWNNDQAAFLDDIGLGIAGNFTVNFGLQLPNGIEYMPVIRMKQAKDAQGNRLNDYVITTQPLTDSPGGLGPIIQNNPGTLWLVGNEVDREGLQDDMMPWVYATAYHDVYHFIKERDPSAQVAISGLVQVTPGRLQYLDIVWDTYIDKYGTKMPVDVWNMHIYVLSEKLEDGSPGRAAIALGTDPALAKIESGGKASVCHLSQYYCFAEHDDMNVFKEQVLAMRNWMKAHGEQQKPLILSEYSILFPCDTCTEQNPDPNTCYLMDEFGNCFTQERVKQFMENTFNYLRTAKNSNLGYARDDNRLVQQWIWFSTYIDPGPQNSEVGSASNLLKDPPTALSQIGLKFQSEVAATSHQPDLQPVYFSGTVGFTDGGTADVPLTVNVGNNGNTAVDSFTVTFYSDVALTEIIGTVTVNNTLGGCARHLVPATVTWTGLEAGTHNFWVKVDSANAIAEDSESDNISSGIVLVDPQQTYLPLVRR